MTPLITMWTRRPLLIVRILSGMVHRGKTYAIRPYAIEYVNGMNTKVTKAGIASPM